MHTVITWQNPRDAVLHGNLRYGNPCLIFVGNSLCYIISGLVLLVVGVSITSLTFQNLERHDTETSERYAGPILIVVGVAVMARGALTHLKPREHNSEGRFFIRSYTGELSSRPIMELSSNSITMCSLSFSDVHDHNIRRSGYNEQPPSYNTVMGCTDSGETGSPTSESVHTPALDSSIDIDAPPSYEECVRMPEESLSVRANSI